MPKELILIGAGGHAQACIDVIEAAGRFQIIGLTDQALEPGTQLLGYPVLGPDEALMEYTQGDRAALVALGHLGKPDLRIKLFVMAHAMGFDLPVIQAPSAQVSKHAQLGLGSIVMHQATVQAQAVVGENCILNDHCLVEHGAVVGAHCHISTGALVNGEARVAEGVFVGSGAILREGIQLSPGVVVGAGAVVTKDLHEPGVYVGNPARKLS
ncbi:MAG: NeuD/PglB/VioB family sugar acetyltransferase [bacterium]|nr:NeuD/PglB/VioB family sugar acetyltransferase [bacterium]